MSVRAQPRASGVDEDMRTRFGQVVAALLDEDERVFVVLAAISTDLMAAAARRHPERVVNAGIMEQTVMSAAAGLALEGFHPVVHSIAPFIVHRPYEQIRDDFVYQGLGVNIVSIGASYDYAEDGYTHQAPDDVGAMLALSGTEVLVPGTPAELEVLLRATYADGRVSYLRSSTRRNRADRPVRFGQLHIVRRAPERPVVVAVGPCLDDVVEATSGSDVSLAYCTTVAPFDRAALRELAGSRPRVVLVEPYYAGALVSDVVAACPGPAEVVALGIPRGLLAGYGSPADHDRAAGLTPEALRSRLRTLLATWDA